MGFMSFDGIDHKLYRQVRELSEQQGVMMAAIDDIAAGYEALKANVTSTIAALQAQVNSMSGQVADPAKVAALEADMSAFAQTVASANPTPAPVAAAPDPNAPAPAAPAVPAQTA